MQQRTAEEHGTWEVVDLDDLFGPCCPACGCPLSDRAPWSCPACDRIDRALLDRLTREALDRPDDAVAPPWDSTLQETWIDPVDLRGEDGCPWWDPSSELRGAVDGARRDMASAAAVLASGPERVWTDDLRSVTSQVGQLRLQLAALTYSVAATAAARGLHTESGLRLTDWVLAQNPGMPMPLASAIEAVVTYSASPLGAPLGTAVAEGRVTVERAARVARLMTRVARLIDAEQHSGYLEILIGAAANPDLTDRALEAVIREILEHLVDSQPSDRKPATAQHLRHVSESRLGDDMTRFRIDAPAEEAALIRSILEGPHAKPQPGEETGELDARLPGQRRFDALMTVLRRGLGNPGAPPSRARASLILMIGFDPAAGAPTGPGMTTHGDVLSRRQAGRAACEAEITPVWLGPHGEPLNLGRTARLATPAQFTALVARDGGCTFPGCTVPADWAQAHHIVWWRRGGSTDLDQLALLCEHHHTHVHEHDLRATVNGGTVTWHV